MYSGQVLCLRCVRKLGILKSSAEMEDTMIYEENEMIGKRLLKIRKVNQLDYYDMAAILGISEGHYRKIERGIYGLDIPKLLRLYEKLDVDPMYLLLGKLDLSTAYTKMSGIVDRKKMLCELLNFCIREIRNSTDLS